MELEKDKAEAYVGEKIPELSFDGMMRCSTCEVSYQSKEHDHAKECSAPQRKLNERKPIQLQHWLRVLMKNYDEWPVDVVWTENQMMLTYKKYDIAFNLTTGQPATEADYKAFNNIVS